VFSQSPPSSAESQLGRLIYDNVAFTDKTGNTDADLPDLLPSLCSRGDTDNPVVEIDANQFPVHPSLRN